MLNLSKYEVCPYSHLCDYLQRTGLSCKGTDPNRGTPFWCEHESILENHIINDAPQLDFPHNIQMLNEGNSYE